MIRSSPSPNPGRASCVIHRRLEERDVVAGGEDQFISNGNVATMRPALAQVCARRSGRGQSPHRAPVPALFLLWSCDMSPKSFPPPPRPAVDLRVGASGRRFQTGATPWGVPSAGFHRRRAPPPPHSHSGPLFLLSHHDGPRASSVSDGRNVFAPRGLLFPHDRILRARSRRWPHRGDGRCSFSCVSTGEPCTISKSSTRGLPRVATAQKLWLELGKGSSCVHSLFDRRTDGHRLDRGDRPGRFAIRLGAWAGRHSGDLRSTRPRDRRSDHRDVTDGVGGSASPCSAGVSWAWRSGPRSSRPGCQR